MSQQSSSWRFGQEAWRVPEAISTRQKVAGAALCARLELVDRETLAGALREVVSAKHLEALTADLAALNLGWDVVGSN